MKEILKNLLKTNLYYYVKLKEQKKKEIKKRKYKVCEIMLNNNEDMERIVKYARTHH